MMTDNHGRTETLTLGAIALGAAVALCAMSTAAEGEDGGRGESPAAAASVE